MNEFFSQKLWGNSLSEWGISLLYVLGALLVAKVLYWLFKNIIKKITKKTKTSLDDLLIDMLEEPVVFGIVILGFWLGIERLHFSYEADKTLGNIFQIIYTINITWLVVRVVDALIEEYLVPKVEKSESTFDDQMLPILRKIINIIIWIIGIVIAMTNVGFDVGALIASLGIGGLALAMAAKDTVSNIFGGFTVFTDKPFMVGDRIKIEGFDGIVTEIGIRSTRLRTLEGRLVTIPNYKFTQNSVENVTLEPTRKVIAKLGLTYDTTPEKMELAMKILQEISQNNLHNIDNNYFIFFDSFGDFALGITFIYYIRKESDILQTQSEMNLEILKRFNDNNLNFAFPSQTIYLEK